MCKVEFAPDSKKIGINDFVISKIPIPNGFAFSTKICTSCFSSIKKDATKIDQVAELEKVIELEPAPSQSKTQPDDKVIHFKNENIAIVYRITNKDEEFISAFDLLTKEGYHLMSIENTNPNSAAGAIFYFQRIKT